MSMNTFMTSIISMNTRREIQLENLIRILTGTSGSNILTRIIPTFIIGIRIEWRIRIATYVSQVERA